MTTLQSLVSSFNSLADAANFFTESAIAIALFTIVLKNESFAIYFIAALVTGFIGFSLAKTHSAVSYGMFIIAVYEFINGMEIVFENDLPRAAWSRIKKLYNKVKGRD
jgi:hypothetical protein